MLLSIQGTHVLLFELQAVIIIIIIIILHITSQTY